MKAVIKEAKLLHVDDVWKGHKPQGLGFSDTDVIIVTVQEKGGKELFEQDFYCRLKADGTLAHSITRRSEKRQRELQAFIRKYVSKEEGYNVKAKIGGWKGKEVELEKVGGVYIIKI